QSVKGGYMIAISLLNEPSIHGVNGDIDNDRAGRDILNYLAIRSGNPEASLFFQNAVHIGPFDTQKEAEECIKKRLKNNIIQFKQPTIKLITDITHRDPSKIVKLANRVYELAKISNQFEVGEELVHEAFSMEYRALIRDVIEYRENLSGIALKIYSVLSQTEIGFTATDIAKNMYPGLDNDALEVLSTSVKDELEHFCKTKFCTKVDMVYKIPGSELAFALKIAMGRL
ncbi:MAG: hypothetical protein KAR20_16415, partial [Candidatus Heimdallarchaeota archaeon]|nr:hypothetical protein [Candidatus Heimdallarchaeota archaeon]